MLSTIEFNRAIITILICFIIMGGIDLCTIAYKYHKFENKSWRESFKMAIRDFFYLY